MSEDQAERDEKAGTAIVPQIVPPHAGVDQFLSPQRVAVHNFEGTPRNIWEMTALACGPECLASLDAMREPAIKIKWFYAHRVEIEKPGGELVDAIRTVLITSERKCYAFVSDGIAQSVAQMVAAFGCKPFDPPLEVRVVERKTNHGFRVLSLTPVSA